MLQRLPHLGMRSSVLLLTVGVLTSVLVLTVAPQPSVAAAPAAAAAPADPSNDYFRMPKSCPQPGKVIPQRHLGCRLTKWHTNRPTLMLWGDSHAWQHLPALVPLARRYKVNLTAFVLGGCPPVHWPYKGGKKSNFRDSNGRLLTCHWSNALALHYAKKMSMRRQPFQLVVGSHWSGFRRHYQRIFVRGLEPRCDEGRPYVMMMSRLAHERTGRLFDALDHNDIRTVATAQAATVPPLKGPDCPERDDPYTGKVKRSKSIVQEKKTKSWLRSRMDGVPGSPDLLDVNGAFCGAKWCRGMKDGIHTWYDDLHISATRMRTLMPKWRPVVRGLR